MSEIWLHVHLITLTKIPTILFFIIYGYLLTNQAILNISQDKQIYAATI